MLSHHNRDIDLHAQSTELTELQQQDLQTLHEIVSLANVFPGKSSFRAIWRAYDVVLAARNINPSHDSVYFRFILQLQGIDGDDIYARFMVLLARLGIDVSEQTFLETPAETTEFTRKRYDEARERRDRSSLGTIPVFSDDAYQGENEAARQSRSSHRTSSGRTRSIRGGSGNPSSSPTREARVAAELAGRNRREEVRARRERNAAAAAKARAQEVVTTTAEEDYDEEEIPRSRIPSDAADALYNVRMKTLTREVFRHWNMRTVKRVEERWFAVVGARAEIRYNTTLVAKAWGVWVQKTAAIVQRTAEVRQRILMRKYFNAWRTIVVENEEKIRLFQLSNAFWKWRERAQERVRMARVAERVYQANLTHRAYWTWFFQLCGILGTRRYHRILREGAFDIWLEKTEKLIQMDRMAKAFYKRRTLQFFFNRWSERTMICIEQEAAAEDHVEWRLTEKTFNNWRHKTKLAPLAVVMGEYVNDRIMSDFITRWRERTRQEKLAAATARMKTLQLAMKTWRLRLRQKILNDQTQTALQASTLHNWILQTRLRNFQHNRDLNLCRTVLLHWFWYRNTLERRLAAVAHRVVIIRNRGAAAHLLADFKQRVKHRQQEEAKAIIFNNQRILRKALAYWRSKIQQIQFMRRMEADALRVNRTHLLSKSLARWRLKADLCRMYNDWAEDAVYYFRVRRTMRMWKSAFKNHRKDRLREAFHIQARKAKRRLAGEVMGLWVAKFDHIRRLNDATQEFENMRIEKVAADQIQLWRLQTAEITALQPLAEEFSRKRLLRNYLQFWIDRHREIQDMNEQADVLYQAQLVRLVAKYLHVWEKAGWHLNILHMTGSRFERKRYQNLLKNWRNAALDKIQCRAWSEEGHGIDDTIDQGFGADWIEPIAADQIPPSTQIRSARNQDLGRSVLGRSVRGGQESSLRRSVLGQSVLGQSIRGTPRGAGNILQTPSWRTAGRSRLLSRTPAGFPMTPRNAMQTPGSPLMRFSNKRTKQALSVMDESQHE